MYNKKTDTTKLEKIKQEILNQPYYYIKHQPENIQNELLQDENFVLKMIGIYNYSHNFLDVIEKIDNKLFKEKYNNIDFAKKAFIVTPFSLFKFNKNIQVAIEKDNNTIKQMCLNSYYAFDYYENFPAKLKIDKPEKYLIQNCHLNKMLLNKSINLDYWIELIDLKKILSSLKLNQKELEIINQSIDNIMKDKKFQKTMNGIQIGNYILKKKFNELLEKPFYIDKKYDFSEFDKIKVKQILDFIDFNLGENEIIDKQTLDRYTINKLSDALESVEDILFESYVGSDKEVLDYVLEQIEKNIFTPPNDNSILEFYGKYNINEDDLKNWIDVIANNNNKLIELNQDFNFIDDDLNNNKLDKLFEFISKEIEIKKDKDNLIEDNNNDIDF